MNAQIVKSLMVPLSEYASVPATATLLETILALEEVQARDVGARYPHRAVLVYDEDGRIVGKVCQTGVIRVLEPDFTRRLGEDALTRFGISDEFLESTLDQSNFWKIPIRRLCRAAGAMPASQVMDSLDEGDYVPADAPLRKALALMTSGCHNSLLVTEDGEIVGILKLADLFAYITREMKAAFEAEPEGDG